MQGGFTDDDLKEMVRDILAASRSAAQTMVFPDVPRRLDEYGDEFGDAFGDVGWNDFTKMIGDPDKVKQAALGSTAKVGTKALSLISVIVRGLPSLVIPFIRTNYERIYARERSRLAHIRHKYPDVFSHADQLFTDDAKLVAFMVNPVLMTAAVAASSSADAVMGLASSLGAGDHQIADQIKRFWRHVNRMPGTEKPLSQNGPKAKKQTGFDDLFYSDGAMSEAASPDQRIASKILRSPEFQQRLSRTKIVQDLKQAAESMKNETLNALIELARSIVQTQSIDDVKNLDSRLADSIMKQIEKAGPDESEGLEEAALKSFKRVAIEALVERVNLSIVELQKLHVPTNAEVISAYQKTLDRIKELATEQSSG